MRTAVATVQQIDVLTQALQTQFITGYDAEGEQPPIAKAVLQVPSRGRQENFGWLFPAPSFQQWKGYRSWAKSGARNYPVPNITYSSALEIPFEDVEDDQTGGWAIKANEIGVNARNFPFIQVQQVLALGQTTACYDGSNFFASTHNEGTFPSGGNIVTGTATGSDGVTHAMVVMYAGGRLKPLLWQTREQASFRTDKGSDLADQNRVIRAWGTLRGAAAFGFPWDAVLVKFSNTPTVADMQTTFGAVNQRFRQFVLPKALLSDPNQYPHGQSRFTSDNMLTVCSSGIEHIARQALTLSLIAQTENYFRGWSDLICSGYLDNVT